VIECANAEMIFCWLV